MSKCIVQEEGKNIKVKINFLLGSKANFPFLDGCRFSEMRLYPNGLSVIMPNTTQTYKQLERGVIIDGEYQSIGNIQSAIVSEPEVIETLPKAEYEPKKLVQNVVKPQTFFPNKTEIEKQETWISCDPKKRYEVVRKPRAYLTESQRRLGSLESALQREPCRFQSEGFGHLKRTAFNARIFFRKPEELDYHIRLLGLLHQKSSKDVSYYNLTQEDTYCVSNFLKATEPVNSEEDVCCKQLEDDVSKAVFMSDRLIEGSGAYGVKRACFHAGENASVFNEKITDTEDIKAELINQLRKHPLQRNSFPMLATRLFIQQESWRNEFIEALQEDKEWALDTGKRLFTSGFGRQNFESAMSSIQSSEDEARPLMTESINYLDGKNFNKLVDTLPDFF